MMPYNDDKYEVDWHADRLCKDDEQVMEDKAFEQAARTLCSHCPVRTDCFKEDYQTGGAAPGIRAGRSQSERIRLYDTINKSLLVNVVEAPQVPSVD